MPLVDTARVKLSCQQSGSGPHVILAHGVAANHAFWFFHLVPALADAFTVTAYDLRGHGLSEVPEDQYTTGSQAKDLAALMDALDIPAAHLVGHSLGAAICLHMAVLHPQRVRSLTLLDARVLALQPLAASMNADAIHACRTALRARGMDVPENTPPAFFALLDELESLDALGAEGGVDASPGLVRNRMWDPDSRAGKKWRRLLSTTSFTTDLRDTDGMTRELIGAVQQPVRLIYGADSPFLPTGRALEQLLPNAELTILPDHGHFFPVQSPDLIRADVRNFLVTQTATPAEVP